MAAKKKRGKKGGNKTSRLTSRPPATMPEVAACTLPWRPTERQLQAAAAVAIDPAVTTQGKIADAIGIARQSVSNWFKDPEFRSWWNDHLMRIHQDGQGSALSILRELFEDPATDPRDRIIAIREYLSALENRKPSRGAELVQLLRELRGAPPGSRLSMSAEDQSGNRVDVSASSPPAEVPERPADVRERARRESDTFLEAGEELGAVSMSPNRSTERAARQAIEKVAKRAADETCGDGI
jgi:hypothetical protein